MPLLAAKLQEKRRVLESTRKRAIASRLRSSRILEEIDAKLSVEKKNISSEARKNSVELRNLRSKKSSLERSSSCLECPAKIINDKLENEKLAIISKNRKTEEFVETEEEIDHLYKRQDSGNYECVICQEIFAQKSKILRHITGKHSFKRPFKCSNCAKSFKYKCDLKAHRLLIHEKFNDSVIHRCNKCDYTTKIKNNLKSHWTRRHTSDYKYSCQHCGKLFKMVWDLKFHVGTHDNSRLMCDICGKFYTSDYSLSKHRKVAHLNDYKFKCRICNKRLLTRDNLETHMIQHDCTYTCDICDKTFASKRYLSSHAKTHNDTKPYACEICEKTFRTLHVRNTHLLTHSSERPHTCDLCGQSFKRRYYMMEHRRKHPDSQLSSSSIPLKKNRFATRSLDKNSSK